MKLSGKEETSAWWKMIRPMLLHQKTGRPCMHFSKNISTSRGNPNDEKVAFFTPEELQVTSTGQVLTSLKSKTIFDLNLEESQKLIQQLHRRRQNLPQHLETVKEAARNLSGYAAPDEIQSPVFSGRYQRTGYAIEKYLLPVDERYAIPLLVMVPEDTAKREAILYLHPQGKAAEASVNGEMEKLVKQGYIVVAPDIRGTGELGPGYLKGDAYIDKVSYNQWFAGILTAKSIVALQAADVVRVTQFINTWFQIPKDKLIGMAKGELAPTLLHTAVMEDNFGKIALVNAPLSYRSLVMHKFYKPSFIPATVAGALTAYDLPDLAASLAPMKLLIVDMVDQEGNIAKKELVEEEVAIVQAAFSASGNQSNFIMRSGDAQKPENIFVDWLK